MGSGVGVVVRRLRACRGELEDAIFAGVREAVPALGDHPQAEYLEGLRAAVSASVGFGIDGLEHGGRRRGQFHQR